MAQTVSRKKLLAKGLLSASERMGKRTEGRGNWIYFTKVSPIDELKSYQDEPYFQCRCSEHGLSFTNESITLVEDHVYKAVLKKHGVVVTKNDRVLPFKARSQYNDVTEREDALYRIECTVCRIFDLLDEEQESDDDQDHELLLRNGLRRGLINEVDYLLYGGKAL